ncbi:toll-like receptor 5b isoform X2 [Gouania willdenowi]|nr:toll-like receptor 5 isoform X2 [Gouania willdenowi]
MCYRSCILGGTVAYCTGQRYVSVPVLPPNVTHLYLDFNYINEINNSSLRDFRYLEELDLGNQKVPLVIRNNAFLRQSKLIKLVLGSNQDLHLELRAFAGLFRLKYLILDYCGLSDSILSENYLEPLISLETLDLFGNNIVKLRPGLFFLRLTHFTQMNLKLNKIETLREEDLRGFRGKHFSFLNFQSNKLSKTDNWENCGNPFRGISFKLLDLSSNGLNLNKTLQFFKAIEGTRISHLMYSQHIGRGFSHNNLPDPDERTFQSLQNSVVEILDLSKNSIFALRRSVFSHLKDAIIIDVSQNAINQINTNAFNGLEGNLRMLNLSWNLLGEIYSHTFTNLNELRVLDLSYNHIGVFGYSSFKGLPKLRALYLTGNSLKNLGSPQSLPNLEYLFLGDNKLKSLYRVDHMAMSSTHVDVSDNKLTNLEDVYIILSGFRHLQTLFFGGNSIMWCTLNNVSIPQNHSLQILDLHSSSLQNIWENGNCLDLFNHLNHLLGLNLSLNSLSTLPRGIFNGLSSIIEIDLSSNALTHLDADVFPVSLQRLDLSNNFLASPDPMTFQSVLILSLSDNHFYCDCNLENFLKWLNSTNVTFLIPVEEFLCEFPLAVQDLPLLNYSRIVQPCEQDDEQAVQGLKLVLFIFSSLLIVTLLLTGIIYTRFRGHIFVIYKRIVGRVLEGPKPAPLEDHLVQYDAFLCFSNNDYRWVEAALLKKLDNQFSEKNMFHCCFEARDFLPGEDHLSNIREAIWASRKTLCIVSKEFLKDGWCLEAFTLAQSRMLEELKNVVVMLVVGKVAHYQLMKCNAIRAFVRRREYLIWPEDPQDLEWFYEKLVSQMLKDIKVTRFENEPKPPEPEEPAEPVEPPEPEEPAEPVEPMEAEVPKNEDSIQLQNIRAIAM